MPETEEQIWTEFYTQLNQTTFVYSTTLTSIDVYAPRYRKQIRRGRPQPDTVIKLTSGPLPGNPEGRSLRKSPDASTGDR
jgi:hypothetical protein